MPDLTGPAAMSATNGTGEHASVGTYDPASDPEPFVILAGHVGGEFAVPAASARAAQQAARHLVECHPHIRATWQVGPQVAAVVVVFGCARPPAGEHLLDQHVHAYPLAPGEPLPPVWVALCGHQTEDTRFEALDHGMGRPCQGCHQRWAAHHQQHPTARGRR